LRFAAGLAAGLCWSRSIGVLPPPVTPLMLIRRVEGYGIDKSWRRLDKISPHLIRAAMAGEDARFCRHHGFDWGAIEIAWDRYQSGHGRLLGASTISMQTAKNVFLWPGRDWLRKIFEAWFTALIELAWGKRWIMEVYLNVVEWGRASTAPRPPPGIIFTNRRKR
jgi:monofunctional glycosyltransferase